ncbi:MAG: bifunctional riboflavin kinase/FAD synthetase [Flavipsychrobacter sp.]|nr:bifunctional riboflavin kinase/FAD synthetase [Flavipsychrobacter sp.]
MAVFFNIDALPAFRNAVITIGTFDGVHLGHRTILQKVVDRAQEVGGESVLITFEPHPRKLLFPNQPLWFITPLEQKLTLITEAGIQNIVVVPFTREFSELSADDYVEDFLVKTFRPHTIIIGYDHRFGHDRTGSIELLRTFRQKYNYELTEIQAQLIDEAAVSSTKVRKALKEGQVEEATVMLGREHSLRGIVVRGAQLGRTIGYPTANIRLNEPEHIIPGIGVYAVRILHNDTLYGGMLSIGYNPTVTTDRSIKIEVNIFEFHEEIYDDIIEVFFVRRLRDEVKFHSLEALKEQLHHDKEASLAALNGQ